MLAMLLASLAADREAIRVARASQDVQALIERIHRLHGATRYCGVPQLRTACQRAENAAHTEEALDDLDKAIIRLESEARVTA
ncbi:Hpt domain-containing protein [Pseudomonas ficuserectae]